MSEQSAKLRARRAELNAALRAKKEEISRKKREERLRVKQEQVRGGWEEGRTAVGRFGPVPRRSFRQVWVGRGAGCSTRMPRR